MRKYISLTISLLLVFATMSVVPVGASSNASYIWNTLIDWEDGISVAENSSNKVTLSASTVIATGTVSESKASISGKTSGWNSQEKTNYVTIPVDTAKMSTAVDLRIFIKQETNQYKGHFGVVIDGVTYWEKGIVNSDWQILNVLNQTFTSQNDNTTKVMTSDDVKKITAVKISFSQHSNYGTAFTADDIEYASIVSENSSVKEETTDILSTNEKTAIRLNEVSGMRFYTTIDVDKFSELVGDNEYTLGTIISRVDKVEGEFTHEDINVDVIYSSCDEGCFHKLWKNNEFVGSIISIKDINLNKDFIARGYVKVGDTYYYSESICTRKLADVADAYIATNPKLDDVTLSLVKYWASAND